ncbi:hypothetical protein HBH98_030670 [Parastagonospora nodorum]|nr:hypothetical protein HBH98_030670 [Parastagonospora nodorum]KAH4395997.1 hypothetical protein HBH97_015250 [Parastagonospora nodorum]KAH4427158.1 hypothetical protein HBH99_019580 [Parastagonospora nodorum]KAH4908188.1 hypothetical protein HBI80_060330 [Parastagonospora nodorum]KAH5033595.1 hypothetical protein HBI74_069310 [Parastagonospora nodorum]
MANDYPFAPPGHAGKGHPAYDNRNRGYNKGRGSYNGGRGGRSQNSGNYGPRAVPVPIQVPSAEAVAPFNFVPDPMAPWAQKYGRYTPGQSPQFFMPLASAPWMSPASPYSTYSGMQPRAFSTSSAPHVGTLAHTPIATPHITIPKAAIMSSGPSTKGNGNLGNSRTNGSGSGAKNAKNAKNAKTETTETTGQQPAGTTASGTGEGASDALHTHAPIPKRIHKLTPKHHHLPGGTPTAHSVLRDFIPYEGQNSVMDAAHNTPDATVKLLDHDSLMQLQVFNITLAHKLQRKLEEAKMAREMDETAFLKKRSILLSLLTVARDSERNHVKTVQRLEERFYSKMQEACKLSGEAKKNGMIAATTQLKAGPDFSRLASEQREKIEEYRNELNDLDNARAISRNKYSDTIHEVLMQALGGKAVGQAGVVTAADADQVDAAQKKTSVVSMAPAQDDRKDSAQIAQLAKDQPVFERQPETEHQSINEVLHRTTVTDAPHESDKTGYVIPPKSRFVDSSTSFKQSTNDTELEAFPDFWVPEKIRGLAPVGDGAMLTAQVEARKDDVAKKQEAKNGDAVKKQDTSKDKAPNTKTENKTPAPSAVPKTQGNDKSKAPVVSKQQPNQSGNQGTGKVRKKNFRKKGGNGGAGGDGKDKGGGGVGGSGMANAAPKTGQAAGDGKDKGAGGKANAIPKTGPAAGDMRKGG